MGGAEIGPHGGSLFFRLRSWSGADHRGIAFAVGADQRADRISELAIMRLMLDRLPVHEEG